MKRMFSVLLSALLLALSCVTVAIPAAAEGEVLPLTDSLVVAYDFEGTTAQTQLQDKAPNGTADNLQIKGTVAIENGVATAGPAHGTDYLTAPKSADLTGITEYTVYVKLKASGTYPDNFADFINIPGFMRAFVNGEGQDGGYTVQARHNGGASWCWKNGSYTFPEETYRYVAYTAKLDAANQKVELVSYYSEDGTVYSSASVVYDETKTAFSPTSSINLAQNTQNGMTYSFDDVLIFNRALSADEVSALSELKVSDDRVGYAGCQESEAADHRFDVRFIGVIDSLTYDEVGFEIVVKADGVNQTIRKACTAVYDSVTGLGETKTAAELGGAYIFALGIRNLPVWSGDTEFEVTPYYIVDGNTVSCSTVEVVYANGNFVSSAYQSN